LQKAPLTAETVTKTPSHIPQAKRNSVVLSLLCNCPSAMDDERKVGGGSFQTRGPETAKLHDGYVIVFVLGNIRSPRTAEQRQRWPNSHELHDFPWPGHVYR